MERPPPSGYNSLMTLQQLRVLVAIVDHGSFSEAGLQLGVGQSSISYTVAELEAELGVRLVSRGRFGATPTPAGTRVAAHARRILELTEAISQEAHLESGTLRGTLRVGTFRSAATKLLPQLLADLRARHPDLSVTIHETPGDAYRKPTYLDTLLSEGHVDVAFAQPEMVEQSVFWELFRDPYVAVVPNEGWPRAERVPLTALSPHPFIMIDLRNACARPVSLALQALDPAFRPAFEVEEDSTVLGMVAQGLGVTVMPLLAIDAAPAGVRVLELEEPLSRRIGVAVPPGNLKIPAVRVFLAALRARFPDSEIPSFAETPAPSR
jgi:DNA-binding transcriptional LysR family regulator